MQYQANYRVISKESCFSVSVRFHMCFSGVLLVFACMYLLLIVAYIVAGVPSCKRKFVYMKSRPTWVLLQYFLLSKQLDMYCKACIGSWPGLECWQLCRAKVSNVPV